MPSFDTVSELDAHEVANAVDQVRREVQNRFDFKGSDSRLEHDDSTITLISESDFQVRQMLDILYAKMSKRGIDLKAVEAGEPSASGKTVQLVVTLKQGLDAELAKRLVKTIKASKLKVQAAIQGDSIRVSGKKRDDLQAAIALLREADADRPLQFNNFRD
ncbi:YajQ family cyclic di-GMP-binding protein [Wenzhouxiangella sp. XN79A]|uniref:YajQ family cyclic di-GMP-binding protein n=1 Tax=Wenzhouxiangella sp. XN79A TaxID=2724193 RepID=UPI00144A60AC|nr:YajQ family cyclic di-GMP-binding protein [Wenzhouxiangella sp. XN79A]NKI34186.1 YajQ family cyclic di-GMP-binding protein [Wenzhouxiangella sp. XN79A]